MEGISVPSRYSVLNIEGEESKSVSNKSNNKKKQDNTKQSKKSNGISNTKKPLKQNQSSSTSKKKTKPKNEEKQWEEWKKKDSEYVDDNFEQDLQSALLQSKLDYEHQKKNPPVIITTQEKKKGKNKPVGLKAFLNNSDENSNKGKEDEPIDETNFFEKIVSSTKDEIRREQVEEKRRERTNNIEEVISLAHCQEKLQKERVLNEKLKKELQQVKEELEESRKQISSAKKRNQTLCQILGQGEMKDKADVLLELERLTSVKEELTEEVTRLHKLLEQERSSTKASSNSVSESHNTKQKIKKKKN